MKKVIIFLITIILVFSLVSFTEALTDPLGGQNFESIIVGIARAAGRLVGGLAMIGFFIAAFLFVFSGGSEDKIAKAKKALFYAILGAAIALAAEGIARYVIDIVN